LKDSQLQKPLREVELGRQIAASRVAVHAALDQGKPATALEIYALWRQRLGIPC
jgi:hypothetical protein